MTHSEFLMHHGVKGQRWGVRNGPPYPIEDPVLKAGTRINSVSSKYADSEDYRNNGRMMYTYRADEAWDNKVYKGPFAKYLVMYKGANFIREHQYETVKDLKMPNKQQRINEFKRLDKKDLAKDLKTMQKHLVDQKIGTEKEQEEFKNIDLDNITTDKDWAIAYSIFQHCMEASWYFKSTRDYIDNLSKKYDAMVDDNNQGIYNDAHDPIIIFKANEALKTIGQDPMSGWLTATDIINNYDEVGAELAKQGRKVKL